MDFALFIVLNGVLLIRPEDLYPEINGLRLYLIAISLCLLAAIPKIIRKLSVDELKRRPVTVCVLGLLGAAAVSQLAHGKFEVVEDFVPEFAKVIAYYLLLVAVVDTPQRFRMFLGFQVVFICVVAAFGVLQYHEYIDIEAIRPILDRRISKDTGQYIETWRLVSAGIFNDPNDLCLILVFGCLCCLYQVATAANWFVKGLWFLPIGLFVYTLLQTQSRGGLIGLFAGLAALFYSKFGWKRALPVILIGVPAVILGIGGRQAALTGDTAHERLMLWADGLGELFGHAPYILTGIGVTEYAQQVGQVAHNSFVHAYVEMGLIGGTLFLAAFVMPVWMLIYWIRLEKTEMDPQLVTAWPYVMGIVAGYCGGVYSLSRNYVVPTYMCLGIATAFLALTMPKVPPQFQVSQQWVKRMAILGVAGLVFFKYFTQVAGVLGL